MAPVPLKLHLIGSPRASHNGRINFSMVFGGLRSEGAPAASCTADPAKPLGMIQGRVREKVLQHLLVAIGHRFDLGLHVALLRLPLPPRLVTLRFLIRQTRKWWRWRSRENLSRRCM
jgi:hypothetical protein